MTDSSVDFVLESLSELINCNSPLILVDKDRTQVELLYEELLFLRTFLKDSEKSRNEHAKVRNLVSRIGDVAYEAEDIVDSFVLNNVMHENWNMGHKSDVLFDCSLKLDDLMEKIKSTKAEVMEFYEEKIDGITVVQSVEYSDESSSFSANSTVTDDLIVGLDDEALTIVERFVEDEKQLDVVSIVGMGGLGKTTLARKVYNHPLVQYRFPIRPWICVSQSYRKRDLIVGILNYFSFPTDQIRAMSDQRLCGELYRSLQGKRYLIVIDDIWDIEAWDYLQKFLPNDNNGSRIMLTSRLTDVVWLAKPGSSPHFMRFLTEDESWDLLKQKAFGKDSCPEGLIEIGKDIAKKCQGLPLAVIVIGGLLAKTKLSLQWWKEVAQSVSSYITTDPEQYMQTLALSYNHMPPQLKSCFLYLGAFPEDYEIPGRKLMLLWMSEGFFHGKGPKRIEEVAEESLMNLVSRNLLMVSQRRSDGGVKACRVHDLLHDLSLRKGNEEKFIHPIYMPGEKALFLHWWHPNTNDKRRMCVNSNVLQYASTKPLTPYVRSFLSFALDDWNALPEKQTSFMYEAFKLIRVLELQFVGMTFVPNEIELLVHLRYLAIRAPVKSLPPSISNLRNLETLMFDGISYQLYIELPSDIGKMVKLRHLRIRTYCTLGGDKYMHSLPLYNLQTISTLCLPCGNDQVLSMIPNIRMLKCVFSELWDGSFPNLECLIHLENLKLCHHNFVNWPLKFSPSYMFPSNLKKLTLARFCLPWNEMSTIGMLPNLEVLKLLEKAFKGQVWETNDGEFLHLKFLKFQDLDIEQWIASESHFPSLQRLVLDKCKRLEEIPFGLGDISSLEMIEVNNMSSSAINSARKILNEQQSMENYGLKILVYPHIEEEGEEDDI